MNQAAHTETIPAFCHGIQYFAPAWPGFAEHASLPAITAHAKAISDAADPAAAYQMLLAADALRYLTLQICAAKSSGHPGGFASSAEVYASLVMLGHTNIVTEVGHHAPGFYSAMFLDSSLEEMGITTVQQMRERFRKGTACSVTCPARFPDCWRRPVHWDRANISPWRAPSCIPARYSR